MCAVSEDEDNELNILEVNSVLTNSINILAKALGVWFIFWSIRRKGEFDLPLDVVAATLRWIIVLLSFGIAGQMVGSARIVPRSILLIIGLAFLCWPNFAYHLTKLFRRDRRQSKTSETG